ncbi:MAG: hypothetical protein JXB10_20645 [Pirellulales bacterium]|nr:hypothetical protein [Pirellulales bacterium]
MARLTDPTILHAYQNALANHRFEGFIQWTEVAREWISKNLEGCNLKGLAEQMHLYVMGGGKIDQQPERRPEWSHYDFHYDLRFTYAGKKLYIETRLHFDDPNDPDGPVITVVNVHLA